MLARRSWPASKRIGDAMNSRNHQRQSRRAGETLERRSGVRGPRAEVKGQDLELSRVSLDRLVQWGQIFGTLPYRGWRILL